MRKILYWLPTLGWMVVIFTFSSRPSLQSSAIVWQDFIIKKTAHFIEFFILSLLCVYSLRSTTGLSHRKILIASFFLTVLYASSDEFHQTFIPGREGRIRDVLIDSTGGLFGLVAYYRLLTPKTIRL